MALVLPNKSKATPGVEPFYLKAVEAVRGKSSDIEDALTKSVNASRIGGPALGEVNEAIEAVAGEMIKQAGNELAANSNFENLLRAMILNEALENAVNSNQENINAGAAQALNNFGQNPEGQDFNTDSEAANDDQEVEEAKPEHAPQTENLNEANQNKDNQEKESSKLPVVQPTRTAEPEIKQAETQPTEKPEEKPTEPRPSVENPTEEGWTDEKPEDILKDIYNKAWTDDTPDNGLKKPNQDTETPEEGHAPDQSGTPDSDENTEKESSKIPQKKPQPTAPASAEGEEPKKPEANPMMDQSGGQPLVPTNEYGQPAQPNQNQAGQPGAGDQPLEQDPNNPNGQAQPNTEASATPSANPPQRGIITQGINRLRNNSEIKKIDKEIETNNKLIKNHIKKNKKNQHELQLLEWQHLFWATIRAVLFLLTWFIRLAAILFTIVTLFLLLPVSGTIWGASSYFDGAKKVVKKRLDDLDKKIDEKKKIVKSIARQIEKLHKTNKLFARKRQQILNQSLVKSNQPQNAQAASTQ